MGLLSRLGRRAGEFAGGVSDSLGRRLDPLNYTDSAFRPVSGMATGGLLGAPVGGAVSMAGGGDFESGALAGAGIGAGLGGAAQLARLGVGPLVNGAKQASRPLRTAMELRQIGQTKGSDAAYAALDQLKRTDPQLADEVEQILMATSGR